MSSPVEPPPERLLSKPCSTHHPISPINRRNDKKTFPPGYRFCPFDGELIVNYLQKKVNNEPMPYRIFQDVNIYMHNPEYLADKYQVLGDDMWYFFSPRERKYPNGNRPKRAAGEGYWKATGADKPVKHEGVVVGEKKYLVFYIGKPPNGDKTNWLMQEYTVNAPPRIKKDKSDMMLDDWVLCKIYKNALGKPKKGGQEEHHEQMADAVTSPEEEVTRLTLGAIYDDNLVEKNYDYNVSSGYIQPPSTGFSQDLSQSNPNTSPEEEVTRLTLGAIYDDNLVEKNYDYNVSSGYVQPPSTGFSQDLSQSNPNTSH